MNRVFNPNKIIFASLFIFAAIISAGQNAKVDSLLNVIKLGDATSETYNQLALEHWFIDMTKSGEFAAKALALAKTENNNVQEGFAYNRLGTALLYSGKLDSALINYTKSVQVFEKLKMNTELAGATACCARIYESKFEYESAINEYKKALAIFEKSEKSEYFIQTLMVVGGLYSKLGDHINAQKYFDLALDNKSFLNDNDRIILYNKIGVNYQNLGNYGSAIKFFDEAFKECKLGNHNVALVTTYINAGNLYVAWGKKEAALNYFEKGLEFSKTTGIQQFCRTILPLIADIHLSFGQLDKAKESYSDLLNCTTEANDVFNEAQAYSGLSKVYSIQKEYTTAIEYSLKALALFEKTERPIFIATTHSLLAENYLVISNTTEAKKHLDIAINIAEKNSFKDMEANLALLKARFNNVTNKTQNSSVFYEKYIAIKDSLFAEQNQVLLAKFQVEMDNLEKDFQLKEVENLSKLKEVELLQKKKQITYISIISLLLLIGAVVFAIMYIRKQKANRILFLKNKELLELENKPSKKGEGPEISESLQNEIIEKLNKEQAVNRVHLRNDLTLHSLSKILETNSSYLSKIIQTTYNTNFSTYLNKRRIIEAQKMILDKKFNHFTIDAISRECGYNSKSTFNKAFKEITGLTPNEYKRQETL